MNKKAHSSRERDATSSHMNIRYLNDDNDRLREEEEQKHQEEVEAMLRPSATTVYEVIAKDGIEEMQRPLRSLWWSGVAAGLGISISLFAMGALRVALEGVPGAYALEKFGYCAGFLIVVMGRMQLFTENTITPVLPVLRDTSWESLGCLMRLWSVVFVANILGTFLSVALVYLFPAVTAPHMTAMLDISMHFAHREPLHAFFSGIPAGFLVAAMVWMIPNSRGSEFWVIIFLSYIIAISNTSHVIVGSAELFLAFLHSKIGLFGVLSRLTTTLMGNIIGGTGLFAILVYAQVREEL